MRDVLAIIGHWLCKAVHMEPNQTLINLTLYKFLPLIFEISVPF
jgi:hypothetical protein